MKTKSSLSQIYRSKKKNVLRGFLHTSLPPLGQDLAEFRAGEKGILSDQRSFILAIWPSMVEG